VITVARRTVVPTGYPWEILQESGRGAQLPDYRSRFSAAAAAAADFDFEI